MNAAAASLLLHNVHVRYRTRGDVRPSLRERFLERDRPVGVHALRGVSLRVDAGQAVGLIGRNGSGKTTLLRAAAGLLPVADGRVRARGTPVLLGIGSALRPALTGRANIELGLLALGCAPQQVSRRARRVMRFADLGDAIDRPLLSYSSGMRARLHFAIATEVRPDVLLVDETLAVGDAAFRVRCEQRIHELLDAAGTLVLVSHSSSLLRSYCTRGLWLDAGRLRADGPLDEVLDQYEDEVARA